MLLGAIRLLNVNKITNKSFAMVCAKKQFCKNVLVPKPSNRNNKYCYQIYQFTTFVQLCCHDSIDGLYCLLIQFSMFGEFYDNKNSNLMIPDNSGIDYARMLLLVLVFLFTGKLCQIFYFSRLRQHLVYSVITKR